MKYWSTEKYRLVAREREYYIQIFFLLQTHNLPEIGIYFRSFEDTGLMQVRNIGCDMKIHIWQSDYHIGRHFLMAGLQLHK